MADRAVLNGNHGLVYPVSTVDGTYGMYVERFIALRKALPPERFNQLLNVRYLVTRDEPAEERLIALVEPFQEHLNRVVRVPGALERATIVPAPGSCPVTPSSSNCSLRQNLTHGKKCCCRRRLISPAPMAAQWPEPEHWGEVLARGYGATRMQFEVQGQPAGSDPLLSEMDFPGWRAEVDGTDRPIPRADYALRAVPLQAGDRLVRLTYEPDSLRFGALLTLLAALTGAALLWRGDRLDEPAGRSAACWALSTETSQSRASASRTATAWPSASSNSKPPSQMRRTLWKR